jgi:hypothetical protein
MPTVTSTHAYTHPHIHARSHIHTHMHTRIHRQAHTTEGNVREQIPTPASPSYHNSPYQFPPQALRVTTRPTNPNPHSPHQQTSLLPRVLFPPNQSAAPLLSLSHSTTSLRFSLALMHSRDHPLSLSDPFTNLRLTLAPTHSRFQQRFPSQ